MNRYRPQLAAWVCSFEEIFREDLLDHDEAVRFPDSLFDRTILVAGLEHEVRGFPAYLLVLLARHLDVLEALRIGALTQELQVASRLLARIGKCLVRLPDPLVDLPKEDLIRRKLRPAQDRESSAWGYPFLEGSYSTTARPAPLFSTTL
jgi:hypothetical protein